MAAPTTIAEQTDLHRTAGATGFVPPRAARILFAGGLLLLTLVGALSAVVWPIAAVLLAVVLATGLVAVREPALGVVAALLLEGAEGLLKARLGREGIPSPDGVVAGLLDLILLATALNLILCDRGRHFRIIWARAGRADRVAWGAIAAWLVISILQIPQSGHLVQGIKGLRLTQAYVPLVLAGVVLYPYWRDGDGDRSRSATTLTEILLGVFALVGAYAAVQSIVGPAGWEEGYARLRTPLALLSNAGPQTAITRVIGSFNAPQELAGFLAPGAAFALIVGFLQPRLRRLAWITFALALVAILESYVRVGLVAIGLGAAVFALVIVLGQTASRRTKIAATVLFAVVIVGGYGLALVAGNASTFAAQRAQGLTHPLSDQSIKDRLHTWSHSLRVTVQHPLGTGVGTVGHATDVKGRTTYVDSSYLKVLQEQGVFGLLFVLGLLGTTVLLGARLARAGPHASALGIAALGGFVSFLTLLFLGEYVELPGKVVAWVLLGVAIWHAYAGGHLETTNGSEANGVSGGVRRDQWRSSVARIRWRPGTIAFVAVLTVVPFLVTATRPTETVAVTLQPAGAVHPPGSAVAYVKRLLPTLLVAQVNALGQPIGPFSNSYQIATPAAVQRSIAVLPDPRTGATTAIIQAKTDAPAATLDLLRYAVSKIAVESQHNASTWIRAKTVLLPAIAHQLADPHLQRAKRRRLMRVQLFVQVALGSHPPAGPLAAGRSGATKTDPWGRIAAIVPGHPSAPAPLWTAVAGFVLGIVLVTIWGLLGALWRRASR